MTKRPMVLMGGLAVVAVVLAVLVMPAPDTGPDVPDRPMPAPAAAMPTPVAPPVPPPRPAAPRAEVAAPAPEAPPTSVFPSRLDARALRDNAPPAQLSRNAGLLEPNDRIANAAAQTLARRNEMYEARFDLALDAIDGDTRQVEKVLDGARKRMRLVEDELAAGNLDWQTATSEVDAVLQDAGTQIDGLLDENEAYTVKSRMGIRPDPPEPVDGGDIFDWGGIPLEEAFGDVE